MRTPTRFLLLLLLAGLSGCYTATLPAQEPITQQQQNTLRATAFKAENEGRFATAADAFLKLSQAAPNRSDWALAAGRCLGRSGRFAEAIDLLDGARKRFPTLVDLQAMLARTLLLRAEREVDLPNPEILWADAAELAEGVLAIQPNHEESRLLLAQTRYLQGDWEQATQQAEEAARRHPQRPGAHVLLGRIATDRMRALLSRYQAEQPSGREQAEQVAAIDEQRQLARRSFLTAAKLDPTRAHPHLALSQIAELDRKPDEARQHVLTALAIDPDVRTDHDLLTRGLAWQEKRDLYRDLRKRYADATTTTELRDVPAKRATLLFHEGRANLDGHDWPAAIQCFEQVKQLNPDAINADYYAFLAHYHNQDHDAAEQCAATFAQASAPGFADVLRALPAEQRAQIGAIVQYLGDRAFGKQRIDNSRDLNHVIACLKDSADAWNNHAFLCRETGRYEAAFSSYQHAIEKEPKSPQLWNDAAVILQHHLPNKENFARARTMYTRALELADKVLADGSSTEQARQFATEAKANATQNLSELPK